MSIGLLFLDRKNAGIAYRFDVRDRCTYWCWLEHFSSMICYGLYFILLILNIIFACINVHKLRRGYKGILKESEISSEKNSMSTPLNDMPKDNNNSKNNSNQLISKKKYINLTKEEKKRIEELKLMRAKCLVYPIITIIIWGLVTTYRIVDTIIMWEYDVGEYTQKKEQDEQKFFDDHKFLHFLVQFFLILHTILSSIRGILYIFSFIIFEEKLFFNFFRKFWVKCCFKDIDLEIEVEEISKSSSSLKDCDDQNSKENSEELSHSNIEMNNSDFCYNEKE